MTLAIDKLHDALKAVPDDTITKHALADAYQTLAFAEWQKNIVQNEDEVTNEEGVQNNQQDSTKKIEKYQSFDQNKGFELYRSLLCDETHTRCSKLRFSYKGNTFSHYSFYLDFELSFFIYFISNI